MRSTNNKVTNTRKKAENNPMSVLADAMFMGSSQAIEHSEAQGQKELCQSEVLPAEFMYSKKEDLEKQGVVFGNVVKGDTMFQHVTLPKGWKIRPTEHSMWTELVDEKERVRASIFYKAAFYDRSAHISLSKRYNVSAYKNDEYAVALDSGKVIFKSQPFELGEDGKPTYDSREEKTKECNEYLDKYFPRWQDVTAYWEQ